jgi:hypothetical protein
MSKNHIIQWHHNRDFISTIDPNYPDWAVTVSFYVALHAVDALLKFDGNIHITDHTSRNATLSHTNRYSKIWKLYHPLFGLSRTVRYLANPKKWVPWPEVEFQIFRRYLYPIEKSVLKLMKKDDSLPPISMKS